MPRLSSVQFALTCDMEVGTLPVSQQTRDQMAQTDHDKLVEYGVMLSTIMSSLARLEQTIKEVVAGQASALASWEATSKTVHEEQDKRIRKLEDLLLTYIPLGDDLQKRMHMAEHELQILKDNKSELFGGWRVIVWISSSIMGVASFLYIIFNALQHICFSVCK